MLTNAACVESHTHPTAPKTDVHPLIRLHRSNNWLKAFQPAIKQTRIYRRGEILFRSGTFFHALYALNSGSVKIYADCDDGTELVFGFCLPGELIGLEGIDKRIHSFSAVALENSSITEISYDALQSLLPSSVAAQQTLNRFYGKEIAQKCALLLVKNKDASERLASFLLNMSERFAELGYSERKFNLSMTRFEIGNYLGLAPETISRVFTCFQNKHLVRVEKRTVEILNKQKLEEAAGAGWPSACFS